MKVKKNNKALNWKRLVSVLCCIVVFCTTYALILPAVTLSKDTYCGKEAHTHDAECYREHDKSKPLCGLEEGEASEGHVHDASCYQTQEVGRTLICGLEEDGEHVHSDDCYETQVETVLVCGKEEGSGATEGHVHNDDCYISETPICGKEEHEHSHECYSNKEDVEDPKDWEETYKDINKEEDAKTRILTVAKNEVGYKENEANFSVDENDAEHYYTRYGHLYEDMYGDWNNYFTGYVLKYANVKMNFDKDINKWISKTSNDQIKDWEKVEEGNVVFFKGEDDKRKTAIVTTIDLDNKKVKAIQGDVDGAVKEVEIAEDKVQGFLSDEITLDDLDTPLAGGFEEVDTYSYKDENLSLVIDVEKGTLPKDAKLNVQKIEPETDEYIQAKETLEAEDEILAVNFEFENEGEPIEVDQDMKVDLDIYNVENPEEGVQIAALENGEDGTLSKKVVADPEKENITVKDNTIKSNFLLEGGVSMLAMAGKPGGGTSANVDMPSSPAKAQIAKTFEGITEEQIPDFSLVVKKDNQNGNIVARLNKDKKVSFDPITLTYKWEVEGLETGKYYIEEQNADITGMNLDTNANQIFEVEAASLDINHNGSWITSCSNATFPLPRNSFFLARTKVGDGDSNQQGIVITRGPITISEQKAIEQYVVNKGLTSGDGVRLPLIFKYIPEGETNSIDLTFGQASLQWNPNTEEVTFLGKNNWQKVIAINADYSEGIDADIAITNTYSKPYYSLNLIKVEKNELESVNPPGLAGAEFELYEGATLVDTVITGNDGRVTFQNQLKEETVYWLKETKAPNGYNILENSIYFKVITNEKGEKVLQFMKKSGDEFVVMEGKPDFVKESISTENDSVTLQLRVGNTPGQELPNTGGAGTKLFTFSGAAVIAASGLMYGYKKKKDKRNGKGGLRK